MARVHGRIVHRHHLPHIPGWKPIVVVLVAFLAASAIAYGAKATYDILNSRPAVQQPVAPVVPVQNVQPEVPEMLVAAPAIPQIQVQWRKVEESSLSETFLPSKKNAYEFYQNGTLIPPPDPIIMGQTSGDGQAWLMEPGVGDHLTPFLVTADGGEHWYEILNTPTERPWGAAHAVGARINGETVDIAIGVQIEPWVFEYWMATIQIDNLKEGASQ